MSFWRLVKNKAIEDIENYKMNARMFFKQYKSQNCIMSNNDGNQIPEETQAITNLFKEHFEKLLNNT